MESLDNYYLIIFGDIGTSCLAKLNFIVSSHNIWNTVKLWGHYLQIQWVSSICLKIASIKSKRRERVYPKNVWTQLIGAAPNSHPTGLDDPLEESVLNRPQVNKFVIGKLLVTKANELGNSPWQRRLALQ